MSALILVVDDIEANRYALSKELKKAGFRVIEAVNGKETLRLAHEKCPDLILLDVKLPDISGYDIVAQLKTDSKCGRIPVIHMSAAFTRPEDHLRGVEMGSDGYLITPIDPLVMLSTVKVWLRVRKADQERDKALELVRQESHELKVAQENLRENEADLKEIHERFNVATVSSGIGVWEYNIGTDTAWRSLSHDHLHGYSERVTEWSAEIALKHIHPDDREKFQESMNKAISEKNDWRVDYRLILPDDSIRWVEAIGSIVRDSEGKPVKIIGVTVDITKRKLAADEVEKAKKKLHEIFMQTPIGMALLTGKDHRYEMVNPKFLETSGRNPVGKTFKEAYKEEEAWHFIKLLDAVYNSGSPFVGKEIAFPRQNQKGEINDLYLDVYYFPFRGSDDSIIGVLAYIHDVTERVNAKKVIEESELQFRTLANSLPQIVWSTTPDGHVDWYNDWFYTYVGLPRGTKWDDVDPAPLHPDDLNRTVELWSEARANGNLFTLENRFRRGSDGQYRWHLVRGVPIKDSSGNITKWVGANTDIHDQKMLLEQLQEERELRERFVATLSHDLRTPLTAAKMSAQVLTRKIVNDPKSITTAHKISEYMDRADRMIRDILDASVITAGHELTLRKERFDLRQLVLDIIEEQSMAHGDRFKFVGDTPIEGNWDKDALQRIVENLLSNAIKYGEGFSPVTVSIDQISDKVMLKVHNFANPIPEEYLGRLFDQYNRADSAVSSTQKGWGLGLTLVKGLVEAHGGAIEVESTLKEGTSFLIKLPLE